jgi:hypothetical protein
VLEFTKNSKYSLMTGRWQEERGIPGFLEEQDGSMLHGVTDLLARRTCSLLQQFSRNGKQSSWVPKSFDDYLKQQTNHRMALGENDRALCLKALRYKNNDTKTDKGCPRHQDWTALDGIVVVSISPKASKWHPELINTGEFFTAPVTDGNRGWLRRHSHMQCTAFVCHCPAATIVCRAGCGLLAMKC